MKAAAVLYEGVLAAFTKADFAKFKFPRLVEADWPTISKVQYWSADLLYATKDWKRAAPAFHQVTLGLRCVPAKYSWPGSPVGCRRR